MTAENFDPMTTEFLAALDELIAADEEFQSADQRLLFARSRLKRIDERFAEADAYAAIGDEIWVRGWHVVTRSSDPEEKFFRVARFRPSPVEGPAS